MKGFLIRISLGFLWVSRRVFRVSFRIQTDSLGFNLGFNSGFHVGFLIRNS
jgi:hypothetical protein